MNKKNRYEINHFLSFFSIPFLGLLIPKTPKLLTITILLASSVQVCIIVAIYCGPKKVSTFFVTTTLVSYSVVIYFLGYNLLFFHEYFFKKKWHFSFLDFDAHLIISRCGAPDNYDIRGVKNIICKNSESYIAFDLEFRWNREKKNEIEI